MGAARLIIRGASGDTEEFLLGDETRLGRSPANDIVLDDPSVSRQHALVRRIEGGETLLIDLGSANGTSVNGQALSVPARLCSSDAVTIGAFVLTFLEERSGAENEAPLEEVLTTVHKGPREESLIGTGPAMAGVFRLLDRAAASDLPVLLEGETGTGKELVARGIHRASVRASGRFVAVSCAILSEELLGTEASGEGVLRSAAGGTLFLDEVTELSPTMQAKLLRVLEDGQRLAASQPAQQAAGIRFLSSTNRDLAAEIERGTFRNDLFYRLAALRIRIPALRDRREDIPLLSERFLRAAAERQAKRIPGIAADALATLTRSDWPGNVRELRNEIGRAVALASDGDIITSAQLSGNEDRTVASSVAAATGQPRSASAAPIATPDSAPGRAANLFRCDGEIWTIAYAGQTALLKDVKGLRCIARLLRDPYQEFHAREFAAEMEDTNAAVVAQATPREQDVQGARVSGSAGEGLAVLDRQAKAEYKRRLGELGEELEEAERDNDLGRAERARTEIDFLMQQLSAAVGLGGRDRPAGSHDERARLLVTQRIKAALKRVAESHAPLGEHLSSTIKTGYRCSYSPNPAAKVDWET